jgi:thiosulfate/3-mercaptopyruvate sulfurtransferase
MTGPHMHHARPVIVGVDQLRDRHHTLVCDVRWYLDGRSGRAAYDGGHIPGAVFVDLDRWLAAPPSPAEGRHPLPAPATFAEGMRSIGVRADTVVIAYDDAGGAYAARLVWLLRVGGVRAALLDGGMAAWDEPLSTVAPVVVPGTFELDRWPQERLATADDVDQARSRDGIVVDARAADRYAGRIEPVDPRAGHIPGAVNLPFGDNLDPATRRFLEPDVLADRYRDAGVDDPSRAIVYCGSGVTACHDLLAMEHAGLAGARLYAGSWSQWSADPARPVATGDEPAA